jgi:hypothetical protein
MEEPLMSKRNRLRRAIIAAALCGGCMFAGPCGITTLQARDFVSSTVIRTGVTTFFSILEAATIAQQGAQ